MLETAVQPHQSNYTCCCRCQQAASLPLATAVMAAPLNGRTHKSAARFVYISIIRNGCVGVLLPRHFSSYFTWIVIQYLICKISPMTGEDALYLVKSSLRRSLLTAKASRTSSRICFRSWLSSAKDCGSGSRPLSVRNFNRTAETEGRRRRERRKESGRNIKGRKWTAVIKLEQVFSKAIFSV